MSHVGALAIALRAPIPVVLSISLALVVGASLVWHWRRGVFVAAGEWHLTDDGHCTGPHTTDDASSRRYRVTQAHRDLSGVRLLLEHTDRRRRWLIVTPDAVEPEVFRELSARIVQHRLPVRDLKIQ